MDYIAGTDVKSDAGVSKATENSSAAQPQASNHSFPQMFPGNIYPFPTVAAAQQMMAMNMAAAAGRPANINGVSNQQPGHSERVPQQQQLPNGPGAPVHFPAMYPAAMPNFVPMFGFPVIPTTPATPVFTRFTAPQMTGGAPAANNNGGIQAANSGMAP